MSEPTLKLPRGADELLREFPGTEPDFEAMAKAVEARLKGSPGGVVFDDLLKAPKLEAEAGEPPLPSSVRVAPKSNFAEMARKSVQKTDDAAAAAKELLAATAASRRPNAAMVERVRAAGRTPATSTPLPKTQAAPDEVQRTSGVVERRPAVALAATPATNRGTLIGIAGVLVAVAACVALFLKSGQPENQTSAVIAAQNAADAPVAATPKSPSPTPAAEKSNDGPAVSPEALAAAPHAGAREESKGGALKSAAPSGAVAMAPAAKSAPVASAAAKPEAIVLEDDPAPAKPADRKPEAAAPEPPLKPAEGSSGSVPLNPSAGAVSTALGSVRSSAQACLAGQTDAVTASVTFAADGHVLRVSAGGTSAACIQAALSKAHIAPFAKESFTATMVVRPP
jgi:hypothetical protein